MEGNNFEPPKPLHLTHNRPLNDLSYKELQNVAMFFHLPANLKQTLLLSMIQARQEGKEEIVNQILVQHKEQRQRNRKSSDEIFISREACKVKRRRVSSASEDIQLEMKEPKIEQMVMPANRNFTNITSGISLKRKRILLPLLMTKNCSVTESSPLMQQVPNSKNALPTRFPFHIQSLISNPQEQHQKQHQVCSSVSTQFQSGVTAVEPNNSVESTQIGSYPCALFRPNSFPQTLHQISGSVNSFPAVGHYNERASFSSLGQYEILNQFSTLPYGVIPISPDVVIDNPFSNMNPCQNSCHNYMPESEHEMPMGYPLRTCNSDTSLDNSTLHHASSVTNVNQINENVSACLEVVLNINLKPITSLQRGVALTNTVSCYCRPLCSPVSVQQYKSFSPYTTSTTPIFQEQHFMERTSRDPIRFDSFKNGTNWSSTDEVSQMTLLSPPPIFQQDNQISFPLIYSYLASTENQLETQHQQSQQIHQLPQQTEQSQQLQQLHYNRLTLVENVPPYSGTCLLSSTSPHPGLQLTNDVPVLDESTLSIMNEPSQPIMNEPSQPEKQKTKDEHFTNQLDTWPSVGFESLQEMGSDSNTSEKDVVDDEVETFNGNPVTTRILPELINCFDESCSWFGKIHTLSKHLLSNHKGNILVGESGSHLVPLSDVNSAKRMVFFQLVAKRVFMISVQRRGSELFITIQWLPTSHRSERPPCVVGILEVVDSTGRPHNWQGVLSPIWYSPLKLHEVGQCLIVDPAAFGLGKYLTIHTLICRSAKLSNFET